jgi:Lon protease-like protein
MTTDLFFTAALKKYFFPSPKGNVTTYDLFDLTLTDLNSTAKNINRRLQEEGEEDFINDKTSSNTDLSNRLEIVKAVIQYKKDLRDQAAQAKQRAQERQRLLEVLQSKQEEALASLPIEEIEKRLAELS